MKKNIAALTLTLILSGCGDTVRDAKFTQENKAELMQKLDRSIDVFERERNLVKDHLTILALNKKKMNQKNEPDILSFISPGATFKTLFESAKAYHGIAPNGFIRIISIEGNRVALQTLVKNHHTKTGEYPQRIDSLYEHAVYSKNPYFRNIRNPINSKHWLKTPSGKGTVELLKDPENCSPGVIYYEPLPKKKSYKIRGCLKTGKYDLKFLSP